MVHCFQNLLMYKRYKNFILEYEVLERVESVENKDFSNLFTASYLKMEIFIVFTILLNI